MSDSNLSAIEHLNYGELETSTFSSLMEPGVSESYVVSNTYISNHRSRLYSESSLLDTVSSLSPPLAMEIERVLFYQREGSKGHTIFESLNFDHAFNIKECVVSPLYVTSNHSSYSGIWGVRRPFSTGVGRISREAALSVVSPEEVLDDSVWEVSATYSAFGLENFSLYGDKLADPILSPSGTHQYTSATERIKGIVHLNAHKPLLVCSNREDAEGVATSLKTLLRERAKLLKKDSLPVKGRRYSSTWASIDLLSIFPDRDKLTRLNSRNRYASNITIDLYDILGDGCVIEQVGVRKVPFFSARMLTLPDGTREMVSPSGFIYPYSCNNSGSIHLDKNIDFIADQLKEEAFQRTDRIKRLTKPFKEETVSEWFDIPSFRNGRNSFTRAFTSPISTQGIVPGVYANVTPF